MAQNPRTPAERHEAGPGRQLKNQDLFAGTIFLGNLGSTIFMTLQTHANVPVHHETNWFAHHPSFVSIPEKYIFKHIKTLTLLTNPTKFDGFLKWANYNTQTGRAQRSVNVYHRQTENQSSMGLVLKLCLCFLTRQAAHKSSPVHAPVVYATANAVTWQHCQPNMKAKFENFLIYALSSTAVWKQNVCSRAIIRHLQKTPDNQWWPHNCASFYLILLYFALFDHGVLTIARPEVSLI